MSNILVIFCSCHFVFIGRPHLQPVLSLSLCLVAVIQMMKSPSCNLLLVPLQVRTSHPSFFLLFLNLFPPLLLVPKGVIITCGNLDHNLSLIVASLEVDPDTLVNISWLPQYHDVCTCRHTDTCLRIALVIFVYHFSPACCCVVVEPLTITLLP